MSEFLPSPALFQGEKESKLNTPEHCETCMVSLHVLETSSSDEKQNNVVHHPKYRLELDRLDQMHEGEKPNQESRTLTAVQFLILNVQIGFYAMDALVATPS